ncbi:hypothetical protein F4859DRAFT_493271 [Xylaria cf. heliscus]|nr:hypothetical protein F4859DRAFT_493271 [Xylaria cf. heliscus]
MHGPSVCIGPHHSNSEIVTRPAVMACWELELFETGEQNVNFKHDYLVFCPKLGSKGVRLKVKGRWMYKDGNDCGLHDMDFTKVRGVTQRPFIEKAPLSMSLRIKNFGHNLVIVHYCKIRRGGTYMKEETLEC